MDAAKNFKELLVDEEDGFVVDGNSGVDAGDAVLDEGEVGLYLGDLGGVVVYASLAILYLLLNAHYQSKEVADLAFVVIAALLQVFGIVPNLDYGQVEDVDSLGEAGDGQVEGLYPLEN